MNPGKHPKDSEDKSSHAPPQQGVSNRLASRLFAAPDLVFPASATARHNITMS